MPTLDLTLFFTWGVSLDTWWQTGLFEREVALYRALQAQGVSVTFVTYGHAGDLNYAPYIPGIRIICNRWRFPLSIYKRLLPFLHPLAFSRCDLIKTNQTHGADVALSTARLWRKPLIARSGYTWSDFVSQQHGSDSTAANRALAIEARVFTNADRIVVTTPDMASTLTRRSPSLAERLHIIPNYVDTDLFRPNQSQAPDFDLIFVGRLAPQKNVLALLQAVQALKIRALFIGDGELRQNVEAAVDSNPLLAWLPHVPNSDLPAYLNRARLFVLPSHYEGHPKSLIEAMACALPVLGARSPGIENLIRHKETGWLCDTSVASLQAAITRLLGQPHLLDELGHQARAYVLDHFSLSRIVQMEVALYTDLTNSDLS